MSRVSIISLACVSVLSMLGVACSSSAEGGENAAVAGAGGSGATGGSKASGGAAGSVGKGGSTSTAGTGGAGNDCIKRGPITEDTVWEPLAQCPDGFDVPQLVEVQNAGTELSIKPGTKLKFQTSAGITVEQDAAVVAVGGVEAPITFTGWQALAGSWEGIVFESNAVANEISNAIVEYAGAEDGPSAAIAIAGDDSPGRVKLTSTIIRKNKKFGLTVLDRGALTAFTNNTITENEGGAVRVQPPSVVQLTGEGNKLENNGNGNSVQIETSILVPVTSDVTWPNLSPAIYRVVGQNGTGGDDIFVKNHLTIAPGAIFEMAGGSGFDVNDGTAGLKAVGTPDKKIIFRGIAGSGWKGIGYCETSWADNALEEVEIYNSLGKPRAWNLCGTGAAGDDAGLLVGHNFTSKPSKLRIKNLKIAGPNNSKADIALNEPESTLTQEGTNIGTGASNALVIRKF